MAPSQGIDQLKPEAFNKLAAPEWPEVAAMPIEKKGVLVGMVIRPVEWPVIAPVPIEIPDRVPEWQDVPQLRPKLRPEVAPQPEILPVPGSRPASPAKPKPMQEITIVIERLPSPSASAPPAIVVRAVQRFKYQIYARQRRKFDAKGIYLRLEKVITLTFGTVSEVQDFVEAAAWNIVDAQGRPVMAMNAGEALDGTVDIENNLVRGVVVNFAQYYEAFDGLMDGRYSLDLAGFTFDYAMSQAGDWEAAMKSKAMERMARALGLDSVMGVDAMMGMWRSMSGLPRQQRESYVQELQSIWSGAFKERVYWSRAGLRTAP